jgi:hypothetical protein
MGDSPVSVPASWLLTCNGEEYLGSRSLNTNR